MMSTYMFVFLDNSQEHLVTQDVKIVTNVLQELKGTLLKQVNCYSVVAHTTIRMGNFCCVGRLEHVIIVQMVELKLLRASMTLNVLFVLMVKHIQAQEKSALVAQYQRWVLLAMECVRQHVTLPTDNIQI